MPLQGRKMSYVHLGDVIPNMCALPAFLLFFSRSEMLIRGNSNALFGVLTPKAEIGSVIYIVECFMNSMLKNCGTCCNSFIAPQSGCFI